MARRDEHLEATLREWRTVGGGIPGPFEAWLALRGAKTLPLRVTRQSATALAVARHLSAHPRVHAVNYPGLDPAPLIRLSVGVEPADDLIADVDAALEAT
jgi:cystathionine gamma-synthase